MWLKSNLINEFNELIGCKKYVLVVYLTWKTNSSLANYLPHRINQCRLYFFNFFELQNKLGMNQLAIIENLNNCRKHFPLLLEEHIRLLVNFCYQKKPEELCRKYFG